MSGVTERVTRTFSGSEGMSLWAEEAIVAVCGFAVWLDWCGGCWRCLFGSWRPGWEGGLGYLDGRFLATAAVTVVGLIWNGDVALAVLCDVD